MDALFQLLIDFGENLALLLALALLYSLIGMPLLQRAERLGAVGMGLLFGMIAVGGMQMPIALAPGAAIDGRNLILLAAAAFGGPLSGIGAATVVVGYGLIAGQGGVLPVAGAALTAVGLGTCLYLRWWRRGRIADAREFLIGGGLLAVTTLPWQIGMLPAGPALARDLTLTLLLLYPLGFLLLGRLLSNEQRQRATLSALRRSEQRFRDVAEAASDWFWETGPDLRFTYLSDRFQQMTGLDPRALLGRRCTEVAAATADPESWRDHLAALERRHPFRDLCCEIPTAAGGSRRVRLSGRPVLDPAGRFQGYRGTAADISAEFEADRALRRTELRFLDAIESMSEAFALFDAEDRLVLCNSRYRQVNAAIAELILPGAGYEELLRASARHLGAGAPAEAPDDWVATRLAAHRSPSAVHDQPSHELLSHDGRWLRVTERRTEEGGTLVVMADITDIKRREGALEANSLLLQATLDSISQGLSVVDADGRLIAWNQRFLDLFELPAEMIRKGMPWTAIAGFMAERGEGDPTLPDWGASNWGTGAATEMPQRFEKCRGALVIETRHSPIPGGGFATTYTDITDTKIREARLAEFAQRNASLAAAVSSTSNGVIITDPNLPGNPVIFVNPAFTRITGYRADEAIGRSCRFLQGRDTDPETVARMRRAITARRPLHVTIRNYRKDGRTFWNELTLNPVFDDRGQLIHFIGIQTDVTDRVRAEEALRRSEQSLREQVEITAATLDALPAHVALLDAAGRILKVNRRWTDAGGTRAEAVPTVADGEDYLAILDASVADVGEEGQSLAEGLRAVLSGARRMFACEYESAASSDRRWFKFVATPVSAEERRGAVVMHFDITDRIHAEEALRAAKDQAEFANRSKSDFLANVSHELRTPLNAIIGFSEIMKDEMFGSLGKPQYREYAQDIHESGVHLLSLINDILDLSKIEAGKFELHETNIRLPDLIRSCLRLVKDRATAGKLALRTRVAEKLPVLHADERAVKQMVINLLSNAVKFTPAGGEITVEARIDERGDFLLAVSDTGIGIADSDIERAMAAFSQLESPLNRKYAGTGLGLPLVRLLAELHGGSIAIDSQVNVGTTVTVRFPQHRNVLAA